MNWDEMAVVGRIARAHGIRGQVIVNLETDFPDQRFRSGAQVFRLRKDGEDVEALTISSVRFHQGRPVIGIAGVEDMTTASSLAGVELRVPIERLAKLPEHMFYRHDLVGCAVERENGTVVGTVTEVEGSVDGSRLVVETADGPVLIPLVAAICPVIDPRAKRIVIAPPEGLLELNRPGSRG